MDVEALSYCIGPLPKNFLTNYPHHVLPCTTLTKSLNSEKKEYSYLLPQPFPYSSKLPSPLIGILKASRSAINGIDPITSLVREKLIWEVKKERLVKLVRKDKKNINGKLIKKAAREPMGGKVLFPQGMAMLAQHLDQDPDPYFSGASYWYYTEGTLATLEHREDQYLLSSDQSRLNYTKVADGIKSDSTKTLVLESKDTIHQISTNESGAVARQRSCISIISECESDDETFKLSRVHKITDKKRSFLSVALPEKSIKTFCTLTNNGILKLWDLERSEKAKTKVQLIPEEGIVLTDSWRQLRYHDDNNILVVDKCCLHMLDARADMKESQNAWCPRDITESCEQVSYVVCSQARPHLVYMATSHQLLCLDIRQGFCKRWTHLMTAPPHLGFTVTTDEQQEMICLGSQLLSDCNVIIDSWDGAEEYHPGSLPSPAKSLLLARQHGLCLDPSFTHRCTQNMTGLTFLQAENSGVHIVRQSSSADIFKQHLTKSRQKHSNHLTQSDLTAFSEWAGPALATQREPADVNVSCVKDFTEVVKAIRKTQVKEEVEEVRGLEGGSSWRLSKNYLEECVDLLAGQLLSVWDVEEEEEWAVEGEEEEEEEQDPSDKVHSWLDRMEGNVTVSRRDVTDFSALNPVVASTPFPTGVKPLADDSPTEPTPWMTNPGQVLRQSPPSPADYGAEDNEEQPWKKQKLYDEMNELTPQKPSTSQKTQRSTAKKKFIPGF